MSSFAEGKVLAGFEWNIIEERLQRGGLISSQYGVESISPNTNFPTGKDYHECLERINAKGYTNILALDEAALQFTTGKKGLRKWHLSPLDTQPVFKARKCVPSFHPDSIRKEWHLGLYLEMAIIKNAKFLSEGGWPRKEKRFHLNPSYDESISILESILGEEWHSLDIETGRNQINTFGVAWTIHDGIAIKMLPDDMPTLVHHKLWELITKICESDSKKVMQNGIYERMYFSRYGIHINNFYHDTMCAMRVLWPELEKGLDNVGRIHTMEPYWKDMGKVASEEGKQKDWGNIRDWEQHLLYNCLDHTGTLEACFSQRNHLKNRGLSDLYDNYVRRLFDPTAEMSMRGFPLNLERRQALLEEHEAKSEELIKQLSEDINPRSWQQKQTFLEGKGIKLPTKRDKKTGKRKPSTDELALKKVRLKHPDDKDIELLLKITKVEKFLSSYLRVRTFDDNRIRFMFDPFSTETGRGAAKKDAWDRGFNVQTMSSKVKKMLEWPEEMDRDFIEIDLGQAESRFVAYDSCEETLLGMLERKEDIHRYVAAEIYTKPMAEITKDERQLGKKSGHGANYSMGVATFQDSCLKEMDLVLDKKMATRVLESYHKLFPGIRIWHESIKRTLYDKRKLRNPLGFERYFYGRMDDNTFREAYAFKPQSTIPMITNYMMFGLCDQRTEGKFDFHLHAQVHDSIILSCKRRYTNSIVAYTSNTDLWHPEVVLPAGKLVIPTEAAAGRNLGEVKEIKL